jgi:hypothetical protein
MLPEKYNYPDSIRLDESFREAQNRFSREIPVVVTG